MPQARDEQRARMAKWFPTYDDHQYGATSNASGIADGPPMKFLLARGWTAPGGMLTKPTPSYMPSIYEVEVLLFLRDEWDYDFHKPLFPDLGELK